MEHALRAIGSKILLSEGKHKIAELYNEAVSDLLRTPEVIRLEDNTQHLNTSRLQHSINVSFYSFRIARILHCDERAAARAGLLHDMFYYNFKDCNLTCAQHSKLHPELALKNAKCITEVSDMEADIILSHMWPMTKDAPKYLEGYIVTFTDKVCTLMEVFGKMCHMNPFERRFNILKSNPAGAAEDS